MTVFSELKNILDLCILDIWKLTTSLTNLLCQSIPTHKSHSPWSAGHRSHWAPVCSRTEESPRVPAIPPPSAPAHGSRLHLPTEDGVWAVKNHLACSSGTRRPRCGTATSSLASRAEGSSSNSKAVSRLERWASARHRAPDLQTKLVMEIPPQALTALEMRTKAEWGMEVDLGR